MEGSRHQTWLTENIDHSESKGSSERVQDQNTEGSNCDTSNEDNSKHTPKFKSPTYNADDSGFVDLCPSQEVDDDVWPTRRESFLLSSTPNRGTLPDQHSSRFEITQSSPIQVRSFQVPPLALRSYFIAQCDTPKWNVDQPRSISNTVLNNVVSNQYTGINYQDYHSNRLLSEYAKLITLTSTGNEQSHVSELTRGHSTIASLLNSRPLHLVNIAQRNPEHNFINDIAEARKIVESVTNDSSADTSTFCKIGEESCKTATITSHYTTPIIRDTVESQNTIAYTCEVDSECLDDKQKFTLNSMSNEYDNDSLGIDKNNNLQLVQKYSDISDACVSDTETSVEASSSEEDPPKVKQDIIHVSNKSKRKARYPRRSAVKDDPSFKGVTVRFQTSFSNGHSRLHMSAFYSNVKVRSPRRRSTVYGNRCSTPQYTSDTDDISPPPYCHKDCHTTVKTCTSCKTRRTPLWRDAEDGTPLCNACGIRYKKYRLRCSKCWHIPKKEVKTYPNCPACGASLRFSFHKKSW